MIVTTITPEDVVKLDNAIVQLRTEIRHDKVRLRDKKRRLKDLEDARARAAKEVGR